MEVLGQGGADILGGMLHYSRAKVLVSSENHEGISLSKRTSDVILGVE
jgi:hypothetical protein